MSNLKIELNRSGVVALLKSKEMKNLIAEEAKTIADRAGAGYTTNSYTGKTRVNTKVWTTTKEAMADNNQNNTLLKSLR